MHHIYNNQSESDGSRINQTDYLDDSSVGDLCKTQQDSNNAYRRSLSRVAFYRRFPLPREMTAGFAKVSVGILEFWLKRSWLLWVLAAVIFAFDQLTKQMIEGWLAYGESWPAEGFLRFTHIGNTGTAFSLFQGNSNILSIVALIAIGLLLWVYRTTGGQSLIIRFALGLQLGGAIGNLADRIAQGYVTDFVDVGPWPIFNVADSAISIGMVLMLSYFFFFTKRDITAESADNATPSESTAYLTTNDDDNTGMVPATLRRDTAYLMTNDDDSRYSRCPRCANSIRYGTLNRDATNVSTLDNHPL